MSHTHVTHEPDYAALLSGAGLRSRRTGIWLQCGQLNRPHGWKLHLSAVQANVPDVLERVAPMLHAADVPFKIAASPWVLALLNEGLLGDTQVGKFMTVYVDMLPEAEQQRLTEELVGATGGVTGPRIVSDLHLGGAVYCRYGEFHPRKRRNRLGLYESDQRESELTRYRVPFEVPAGVGGIERFSDGVPDVAEPALELKGAGYLPIGTIARQARGDVILALDMRAQEDVRKVVLKQGRAGCMSDAHGRDIRDRLRHHQHVEHAIRGRVATPAVQELFADGADLWMAVDCVDGFTLDSAIGPAYADRDPLSRAFVLEWLRSVAAEIGKLHACGYLHRDLSPTNVFILPDNSACLIDLELAYELGQQAPPFMQGTVGFISPQQEKQEPPAASDDAYSFGALAASLLTGVPGHLLPVAAPDLDRRLSRLSGAGGELCRLVAACLSPAAPARPPLAAAVAALERAAADTNDEPVTAPADLAGALNGGVAWLVGGAPRDERSGMWMSPALESAHAPQGAPVGEWRVYRSTNRGVAGVVYLLAKLWRLGLTRHPEVPAVLSRSVDWLLAHHDSPDDQLPGLHFGEAGVAVALSEAIASGLIERGAWTEPYLRQVFSSKPDWPDLTHGAAGQGLGALICGGLLRQDWINEASDVYAAHLRGTQTAEGTWVLPAGVAEMEGKSYTGCAHGAAGIVHFLAVHGQVRGDASSIESAVRGGEWLLDEAAPTASRAGLSWPMTPGASESWTWWCHGAPGIAQAFLSLYEATGDALHSGAAHGCLRTIAENLRAPNLSQCHGLAGLGELLMEGADVLGDADLRRKGAQVAHLLADLAAPVRAGCGWRVENLFTMEADLMTGSAGVMHVIARALHGAPGFGMPLQRPEVRRA